MRMVTGMYNLRLVEEKVSYLPWYVHFVLFTFAKAYEFKVSRGVLFPKD